MRCCFITLGCRVNQYESDAMAELLASAGHSVVHDPSEADVCIINTCTVTNIADRKSRQMLSKAHRINPNSKLVVCGCWAQRNSEAAKALEGVDAVMGSSDRGRIVEIVDGFAAQTERADVIDTVREVMHDTHFEELSAVNEGRTRAYLKIQDGCNMFCTYCAIPYARGALRSRSLESIRREAEKLNVEGYPEVVLTGIHLMSYGVDLKNGTDISNAVKCFAGLSNIRRIRFGSLEPHLFNDRIIASLAEEKRICRQFHLSLQSGSDTVLERMKRGYTSAQYLELCSKLRAAFGPETAVTTDIIAGFPGETLQEHAETIAFMKEVGFAKVHIFPYSRRSGTKADRMPDQLTNAEKSARAKELIAVGKELEKAFLERFIGTEAEVLVETTDGDNSEGYTDTYARVIINEPIAQNSFVRVQITEVKEDSDGELSLLSHRSR